MMNDFEDLYKMGSELNPIAEDVNSDLVEKLTVDVRLCVGDETMATDGEYLAHGVATTDDAFSIRVSSPNGVVLDYFNDDRIFGDASEKRSEVAV